MSSVSELLTHEIYPALYSRLDDMLPEFGLVRKGNYWQSTNKVKTDGTEGDATGKVYIYENTAYGIKDWTRGFVTLWDYLREQRGMGNAEILRTMAALANVILPDVPDTEQLRNFVFRTRLASLFELLNDRFLSVFHTDPGPDAARVREYCLKRGYTLADVRKPAQESNWNSETYKMELGCMPSAAEIYEYIQSLDAFEEEIKEAAWSRFDGAFGSGSSHRLTIPFRDPGGKILGFIARNIFHSPDGGDNFKYLYTKGLEKQGLIFNLRYMRKNPEVVITEGQLDALHATVRGFSNVVALGGSSLNEKQLRLLKTTGIKRITLVLDADKAGAEATRKAVLLINRFGGFRCFVATLPPGIKDPDQCLRELGSSALSEAIDNAASHWLHSLNDLQGRFETRLADTGVFTSRDREQLVVEALEPSNTLSDPIDRDSFFSAFITYAQALHITRESFREKAEQMRFDAEQEREKSAFIKMVEEARQLLKEGFFTTARELLSKRSEEIKVNGDALHYHSMLAPFSEAQLIERIVSKPQSISTGFHLRDAIGRLQPLQIPAGAITIVPARTSHGKTAMALNLMLNMALAYPDRNFHFFSYEEDASTLYIKLMNIFINEDFAIGTNTSYIEGFYKKGGIGYNNHTFRIGREKFYDTLINTGRIKIHYGNLETDGLLRAINYLHRHDTVGAVFIDYIQMLRIKGNYNSRQLELQSICNKLLNEAAVPTGLPIILGAQFNRDVQCEGDMDSSKIREAGDIEQTANLILGMWNRGFKGSREGNRDKNGRPIEPDPDTIYLEVLKNRDGQVGLCNEFKFNGQTGKIENKLTSSFDFKETVTQGVIKF
ncbi:MAG: DnaB-like helicase C-terminal domain-containing protein [Bacteroidota bacterium]